MNNTLGFHRQMAVIVFGEDSPAVKFLDYKIKESPKGEDEEVIADEGQMVALLTDIHFGGKYPIKDVEILLTNQ